MNYNNPHRYRNGDWVEFLTTLFGRKILQKVKVFDEDYTQPRLFSYDSGWKSFLGGKWRHGVGSRYVWYKYDHNNKTHKTTVQGASGQFSYSGCTSSGSRAEASWEKALSGNRAWADVK